MPHAMPNKGKVEDQDSEVNSESDTEGNLGTQELEDESESEIDDLSARPDSVTSQHQAISPVTSRKRSFFPMRRKRQPSVDSTGHAESRGPSFLCKRKGPPLGLFRRKGKAYHQSRSPRKSLSSNENRRKKKISFDADLSHQGQRTAEAVNHASDRLVAFERGTYNLNEELSRLSESGINDLREQLSADNKECSEKIKTLLHQHYRAFISASKGIKAMEVEMQALRAFLNKEHSLLNSLKEIADPQGRFADRNQEATTSEREWTRSWDDSPEGIRWHAALQELDIVIAERRIAEALPLLKKAERTLMPGQKSGLQSHMLAGRSDVQTEAQAKLLAARRQQLSELSTRQIAGSNIGSKEMQVATQVIASLSGRADALRKHLEAHSAQLRKNVNQLLKLQSSGADADGTDFSNALGQQVFGAIATASEDVTLIFGKELKELASLFMVWALTETEKCAVMLKRHALSPFAAPAGLGPTMACCLLAYLHCLAIQSSHYIRLAPRLMRDLWPACDQVMQRRIKRIVEDVKAAVGAEVETLICHGLPVMATGCSWSELMQVLPSADLLLDELEAIVKILMPMAGPRVREALNRAFTQAFREYTNVIAAQFTHYRYADGTLPKVLDDTIEMALEVTHSLVEQFLPELAQPLKAKCGEICNYPALREQLQIFEDKLLPPEEPDTVQECSADADTLDGEGLEAIGGSMGRASKEQVMYRRARSGSSELRSPGNSLDQPRSKFAEDDRFLALGRQDRMPEAQIPKKPADISALMNIKGQPSGPGQRDSQPKSRQHGQGSQESISKANGGVSMLVPGGYLSRHNPKHSEAQLTNTLKGERIAEDLSRQRHACSEPEDEHDRSHDEADSGNEETSSVADSVSYKEQQPGNTRASGHAPNGHQAQGLPKTATSSAQASDSASDDAMVAMLRQPPMGSQVSQAQSSAVWSHKEAGAQMPVYENGNGSDDSGNDDDDDDDDSINNAGWARGITRQQMIPSLAVKHEDVGPSEGTDEYSEELMMQQLTRGLALPNNIPTGTGNSSDVEEMNEDLSEFDEDEMLAQLTKIR